MQTLSSGSVSTPKRQSCDRCHKQKLRCLRPSDGDGGACERCIRSKAQCVYSSSLPKGRPSSHRQNRQTANAANVRSSSRNNETSSEGTLLGVDNNDHPATVTDKTIIAEQHLDQTMTAAWDDSINWMEYIDNALPDQWYSELQNNPLGWIDLGHADPAGDTIHPASAPGIVNTESRERTQQTPFQAISRDSNNSNKAEPETAVACLSRLSHRLHSLYSAVLQMANSAGALDQANAITLQRGPFADDSAFQTLTGWLVYASSNTVDLPVRMDNQENSTHSAGQDGCDLLHDVFSASRDLLNALHSSNAESSKISPYLGPLSSPLSPAAAGLTTPQSVSSSSKELPSCAHWSNSIVRHMVMACHLLLLNTYLAVTMALQHAVDKQRQSQDSQNVSTLPLGDVRTAMMVQLCGYLTQRQVRVVQAYLAPSSSTGSSNESTSHDVSVLSSSDQEATEQLEKDVEQRLARLRQSLHIKF